MMKHFTVLKQQCRGLNIKKCETEFCHLPEFSLINENAIIIKETVTLIRWKMRNWIQGNFDISFQLSVVVSLNFST